MYSTPNHIHSSNATHNPSNPTSDISSPSSLTRALTLQERKLLFQCEKKMIEDPTSVEPYIIMARIHYATLNIPQTSELIRLGLQRSPDHPALLHLRQLVVNNLSARHGEQGLLLLNIFHIICGCNNIECVCIVCVCMYLC